MTGSSPTGSDGAGAGAGADSGGGGGGSGGGGGGGGGGQARGWDEFDRPAISPHGLWARAERDTAVQGGGR